MNILESIILGIVQGLTEFLPVFQLRASGTAAKHFRHRRTAAVFRCDAACRDADRGMRHLFQGHCRDI